MITDAELKHKVAAYCAKLKETHVLESEIQVVALQQVQAKFPAYKARFNYTQDGDARIDIYEVPVELEDSVWEAAIKYDQSMPWSPMLNLTVNLTYEEEE